MPKGQWLQVGEKTTVFKGNDKKNPNGEPTVSAVPAITVAIGSGKVADFCHVAIVAADPSLQPIEMGAKVKWLHSGVWNEGKSHLHSQRIPNAKWVKFNLESSPDNEFDPRMHAQRFRAMCTTNGSLDYDQLLCKFVYVLLICSTDKALAPPLVDERWSRLGLILLKPKRSGTTKKRKRAMDATRTSTLEDLGRLAALMDELPRTKRLKIISDDLVRLADKMEALSRLHTCTNSLQMLLSL